MQVVPISNKMVTGNASAADGGERCFVHLGQLVRAWIRARVLERVRRQLRRWSQCGCGCGVGCGAGRSAERGCGLVAVVHAWAVSCAGERGTSTSCERVAERERELEAQVLGARCGARNARAVVGGVRVLWWVLVRVVVAVRMVVAIRERGCCALFCGFFSTIQSKTENRLSFFNQKAYSDIRLIDYSVGFCNAQFLCDCASRCCIAISARERITLLPHDAKTRLLRGCASRCCNNASCTPGSTCRSRNSPLN